MNHAHGPVGNPGAWFGPDAYPPAALRRAAQGRTVAKLAVDADGRVTGCTVQVSSGDGDLDAGTCGVALGRGRFEPAVGADGPPIPSSYVLPVRWVIPDDRSPTKDRSAPNAQAAAPRQHGWLSRLGEAHHLFTLGAGLLAFLMSRVRRALGWAQLDADGRELPDDRPGTRTALDRLRSGRFGPVVRVFSVAGPIVVLAIALAWFGW